MATVTILLRGDSPSLDGSGDTVRAEYEEIDLDLLSPIARALAEAVAARDLATAGVVWVQNQRDPADRRPWSGWASYPATSTMDPHTYLEKQAAKFPPDWSVIGRSSHTPVSVTPQEQTREWTAQQCAKEWGVLPGTWRSYVARGQAPQPVRRVGATPLWDAEQVRSWPRPGQGARTDRAQRRMDRP